MTTTKIIEITDQAKVKMAQHNWDLDEVIAVIKEKESKLRKVDKLITITDATDEYLCITKRGKNTTYWHLSVDGIYTQITADGRIIENKRNNKN